ncbi:MAG: hypothetical protein ABEJ60_03585 [Halodesulfurarchaeum sp.]
MGIEIVDCPVCGREVTVGVPRGSEVRSVDETGQHHTTDECKSRQVGCPAGHDFWVQFAV